jgi:hypothetical protein
MQRTSLHFDRQLWGTSRRRRTPHLRVRDAKEDGCAIDVMVAVADDKILDMKVAGEFGEGPIAWPVLPLPISTGSQKPSSAIEAALHKPLHIWAATGGYLENVGRSGAVAALPHVGRA